MIAEACLVPSLQVYFPEGSLQFEIVTNPKESPQEAEAARRGHHTSSSSSSSFDEARRKLLRVAAQRIETQRKHQQLLRSGCSSKNRSLLYLHCNENPIYVFTEKELRGPRPNFHMHVSMSDLYIPTIGSPILVK